MDIGPPRGFRDLLPETLRIYRWVEGRFRRVISSYGFEEILTPTLERFELFERKAGEEIERSLFVLVDKSGRKLVLRPELTAPVARVYASAPARFPLPLKLFYLANVFRYEEPQKMRYREFWQAGAEIIGSAAPEADAEILALVSACMESVGLREVTFKVGDVRIIRSVLSSAGLVGWEDQNRVMQALDKRGKLPRETFESGVLASTGGDRELSGRLLNLVDLEGRDPSEVTDLLADVAEAASAAERVALVMDLAKSLGLRSNLVFSPGLARGLVYYTGFVFEVYLPDLPYALGGGGRYDELISLYGGPSTPATGVSVGIDRVVDAVRERGLVPRLGRSGIFVVRAPGAEPTDVASIAAALRARGIRTDLDLRGGRSVSKQLEHADRMDYAYAAIFGSREKKRGVVTLRNLEDGSEREVPIESLPDLMVGGRDP